MADDGHFAMLQYQAGLLVWAMLNRELKLLLLGQVHQTKFMSKAQKRRHYDRFGATNEKPRGHDWVDVVTHLARR